VVFTVAFVLLATWGAILLASMLDVQVKARGFFRAVFFVPVLLSPVVVGLLWNWMLDRQIGVVNALLGGIGLPTPGWLVDPHLALGVVVFTGLWTHVGFYTMILLAGLQGIDGSLYEAAKLDGAGSLQLFRRITLPLLRPTTLVVIVLATVNGFQAYDYIYTLTGGGPLGSTTLLVQYIYDNAFRTPIDYGFASAAGVLLFGVVFVVTLVNFVVGRRREAV
jgi:alpha-1,4-digalacturonate transport system permease protein